MTPNQSFLSGPQFPCGSKELEELVCESLSTLPYGAVCWIPPTERKHALFLPVAHGVSQKPSLPPFH